MGCVCVCVDVCLIVYKSGCKTLSRLFSFICCRCHCRCCQAGTCLNNQMGLCYINPLSLTITFRLQVQPQYFVTRPLFRFFSLYTAQAILYPSFSLPIAIYSWLLLLLLLLLCTFICL